jgi:hypothetical protein
VGCLTINRNKGVRVGYILGLVIVFFGLFAQAGLFGAPYMPEADKRFSNIEADIVGLKGADTALQAVDTMLTTQTADGLTAGRVARVTYDVAVDGGTIAARGLGVTLPAKTLIKKAWFYTVTQFADAGSGTVALHCEDANNIFTATDITGNAAGVVVMGAADGAVANMVKAIGAACEVTATVAGAAQTQGKLILYIEYVVHD